MAMGREREREGETRRLRIGTWTVTEGSAAVHARKKHLAHLLRPFWTPLSPLLPPWVETPSLSLAH